MKERLFSQDHADAEASNTTDSSAGGSTDEPQTTKEDDHHGLLPKVDGEKVSAGTWKESEDLCDDRRRRGALGGVIFTREREGQAGVVGTSLAEQAGARC